MAAPTCTSRKDAYGFFLVVSFFVVSMLILVLSIFMPVSVAAADGAGAIAGGVVSLLASDFEQAATTASTAATKARRFMTFS